MKKLLRVTALLLLLVLVISVVYTQSRVSQTARTVPVAAGINTGPASAVAQIAAHEAAHETTQETAMPAPAAAPIALGTETAPLIVKLTEQGTAEAHARELQSEHNMERYALRIAASSLAQNILMCIQATLFLMILIVLYRLSEHTKRMADAAERTAQAAHAAKPEKQPKTAAKFPPHYYRKR